MNYYAQGGQAQGIKSLARELPNYGRYNDDMVAHISSDEARLLKSLGGAGTINPVTGLPEYGLSKAWKKVTQPIEKAIVRPIGDIVKPIAQDLGIVGQLAATYFGGPLGAGLYAGIAGGGKGFDFKRALMAGALAYGVQNLAQGVADASGTPPTTSAPPADVSLAPSGGESSFGLGNTGATDTGFGINAGPAPVEGIAPSGATASGSVVPPNTGSIGISAGPAPIDYNPASFIDRAGTAISDYGSSIYEKGANLPDNLSRLSEGAGKLLTGDPAAVEAFKNSGVTMTNTALPMLMGYSGVKGIDETQKLKDEADLAAAKDETERAAILARIEESKQRGIRAMQSNPYQFAYGGPVDDEPGLDDWNNYTGGGIASMAKGGMPPRFLSGGGDGMSDDIKATINGKQPARLADGEFVIPADVVSHLGNGSSKAGAKKLYSMMDRVRHARTGNKKQGKQINPNKFLLA